MTEKQAIIFENLKTNPLHKASVPGIQKVGIIGEGKMGSGILNYLLDFNYDLVWVCSPGADAGKIKRQLDKKIKRSLDAGIIDQMQYEKHLVTSVSSGLTVLTDCDLIIEAVPEIVELKKSLFSQLDNIVKSTTIFASNSSSIKPSEMAPIGDRSGKFTGLHFFYPVSLKNIVELTISPDTTEQTLEIAKSFLTSIRKRFITLEEQAGFILNRIFLDIQNEAFLIVQSGQCTCLQMDQLVKKYLFPFGIFDFCDSVGLDTMLSSIENYTKHYQDKSSYKQFIAALFSLVSQGNLGVKTRQGFYRYPLEETVVDEPASAAEIVSHLHRTWVSASARFAAQAKITTEDANFAVLEYFDVSKGPFE